MLTSLRVPVIILLSLLAFDRVLAEANFQHVSGARRVTDTVPAPTRHVPAPPVYRPPTDSMIENRLVELALQGPQYQATGHQVKMAQSQLSKAKKSWLNLLALSANYNDQTFAKNNPTTTGGYIYPKYFFGLTIPLGVIFAMGPEIRGAREGVAFSESNKEELARQIRADVLSKYKQYKTYGELISLQNTIVIDQQTALSQTEKKFKDGTITIEQYNIANRMYSDEQAKKLNLQLSQDLVKLAIEKLIGVSLESVIR